MIKISKGRVLIRPFKYNTINENNLLLPENFKRLESKAEVIDVSEETDDFDSCKVGDIILYDKYVGYEVNINNERYEIIENTDVVCIIDNGNYKIPYNYVLVKTITERGESGVGSLVFDTSWQKERFNHTFAQVITPPQKLIHCGEQLRNKDLYSDDFIRKINNHSLGFAVYENKVDLEYGDIVHFHYLAIEGALVSGYVIVDEITKERLYIIRYDLCYAKEDKKGISFINGFLGLKVEDISESKEMESGLYSVNLDSKNLKKWGYGEVVFMSKPNSGYMFYDINENFLSIKVGDLVNFKPTKKMMIGNNSLLKNEKLKEITIIQRKDINFAIN